MVLAQTFLRASYLVGTTIWNNNNKIYIYKKN